MNDEIQKSAETLTVELAQQTDNELLVLFVDHQCEDAFNELVSRHSTMVLNVCLSVVSDRNRAEDAFQVTFLALLRHASRLRSASSFAGWLYRVAYRASVKAAKQQRSQAGLAEEFGPTIQLDPLHQLAARETIQTLVQELNRIPRHYREALTLFYLERLTRQEIAARMDRSVSSIQALLMRGKRLLKNRLLRKGFVPSMVVLSVQALSRAVEADCISKLTSSTVALCAGSKTVTLSALIHSTIVSKTGAVSVFVKNSLAAKSVLFTVSMMSIAVLTFALAAGYARAENRPRTVVTASFRNPPKQPGSINIQKMGQEYPTEQELFAGELDFDQWQSVDDKWELNDEEQLNSGVFQRIDDLPDVVMIDLLVSWEKGTALRKFAFGLAAPRPGKESGILEKLPRIENWEDALVFSETDDFFVVYESIPGCEIELTLIYDRVRGSLEIEDGDGESLASAPNIGLHENCVPGIFIQSSDETLRIERLRIRNAETK